MNSEYLKNLQEITAPFAYTSQHVQGPGGNTSYKNSGNIAIKASGYTFKSVTENIGVVVLDLQQILDKVHANWQTTTVIENMAPQVIESVPPGLKPSMEYEFHSLLSNYVLHTHAVYANVVTCSKECAEILASIFNNDEYLLLPYVTPGFPIAQALLHTKLTRYPPIIFLKNHGIIVHGDAAGNVIDRYNYAIEKIRHYFGITDMPELHAQQNAAGGHEIPEENIYGDFKLSDAERDLIDNILIPDQSIFFRNKISADAATSTGIFLNSASNGLTITGSDNFILSAKAMIQAVYFIKHHINSLKLTAQYIPTEKVNILHELSAEKTRLALLNK